VRQGIVSTQVIPQPARESRDAVWDSLRACERTRRWAASESLATTLIGTLEKQPSPDSLALSRAWFYLAHSKLMRRLYADGRAVDLLERGIAVRERHPIPHDTLTIWAHVKAATMFPEAGHPKRAVEHGELGLKMLEATAPTDTSVLAQAHLAMATALVAVGRDPEAGPHFESAIVLRERADGGESLQLFPILAEYGSYLSRIGEMERARALLRRAVGIAERNPNRGYDYTTCLGRLSTFEDRVGNIAESIDLAGQAYEACRQIDPASVQTLRARTTLAYRLQEFGDMQGSVGHLQEILPPLTAALGASHPQALNARYALIQGLLLLGDSTAAAHELAEARPALARQDLTVNNNQLYAMQLVADLESLRGRYAAARETLSTAVALQWSRHDPFGGVQAVLLAHLYDNMRDASDRERVIALAGDFGRLTDSTHVKANPEWPGLLLARAGAEARTGLHAAAWQHALEAEQVARERLTYQLEALSDLRGLQLAQQFGRPCELLIAIAGRDSADELATAWDRVIHWRGLVRHEIGRRRAPASASSDTAVAGAHARWVAAQQRLAQMIVSGAAHPEDPASAARYERSKQQAEEAERAFVRSTRGSMSGDSTATLAAVLAQLRPDQAIVAFASASDLVNEPVLGAFIANGRDRRPRWIVLGPARDIERDVQAWTSALATPPAAPTRSAEQSCRRLGERVRKSVWDPIRRAAGDAREMILIPEGAVTEMAWLALPEPSGRYLAEASVSVRLLAAERDLIPGPPGPAGRGLLALGGPAFADAPSDAKPAANVLALRSHSLPCAGVADLALPDLPGARLEAERIVHSWPATAGNARLLEGADATERAWKSMAPGNAVIHLATHGVMVDDSCRGVSAPRTRGVGGLSPLSESKATSKPAPQSTSGTVRIPDRPWLARQVWLALAGANGAGAGQDANEGLLTAEEVVTLDLRGTEWVVLSACHSGFAAAWTREGTLGMRRAFQIAGARAVIASSWAVGDESAAEWMSALYASRARGRGAGAAAGEATRAVLAARRAQGRSTHPFHWAAFTAWGE
jgi:tetratricopeptide (TPR) repeat protein